MSDAKLVRYAIHLSGEQIMADLIPIEIDHGGYYIANDVDKHVDELQRSLDAARARIKELERDLEYEKQQHGITSSGTDVLVKLAIERCAGVVKAHSEHMYGIYTELDDDTAEADRLLADISMLDDITREIAALSAQGE